MPIGEALGVVLLGRPALRRVVLGAGVAHQGAVPVAHLVDQALRMLNDIRVNAGAVQRVLVLTGVALRGVLMNTNRGAPRSRGGCNGG